MIQELISTSAPRCLSGNAGYGIVAQTTGMAPNVSRAVDALSGYTHIAAPGSGKNPVIYLHAVRQTGGMLRHIVSRIDDCGNDYTGRSNRIAHHWIIEEGDVHKLKGGPAAVLTTPGIFEDKWDKKPELLPSRPQKLSPAEKDVPKKICKKWEELTGDAGWGGVVAECAEKGNPVSIIFSPQQHSGDTLRTLIGEALALLPSSARWRITFSTYYMRSQETSDNRIQIKCFSADSEVVAFAKQSRDTLYIDLQKPGAIPIEYEKTERVKLAREGQPTPKVEPKIHPLETPTPVPMAMSVPTVGVVDIQKTTESETPVSDNSMPGGKKRQNYRGSGKLPITEKPSVVDSNWPIYLGGASKNTGDHPCPSTGGELGSFCSAKSRGVALFCVAKLSNSPPMEGCPQGGVVKNSSLEATMRLRFSEIAF